jgi:SAM-dependent methyltransferase
MTAPVVPRDAWTHVAPLYAETFGRCTALAIPELIRALEIAPRTRVLDVGCGPGGASHAALAAGARVVGADFAAGMLAVARAEVRDLELVRADAHALPCRGGSFDAVMSNFGVHAVADPPRMLAEFRRVLRPGGRLAIVAWDGEARSDAQAALEQAVDAYGDRPAGKPAAGPLALAGPAAALLEAAGFREARTRRLDLELRVTDGREIFEAFRCGTVRTAAMINSQSAAALERIRNEFVRLLAPWTTADVVAVPMCALLHTAVQS